MHIFHVRSLLLLGDAAQKVQSCGCGGGKNLNIGNAAFSMQTLMRVEHQQ